MKTDPIFFQPNHLVPAFFALAFFSLLTTFISSIYFLQFPKNPTHNHLTPTKHPYYSYYINYIMVCMTY